MKRIYAWKTGAALAIAIALGYAICAVLFAFWPGAGAEFGAAIVRGAGYEGNEVTHWSGTAFIYAVAILLIWAFATGALFAWVHSLLHRSDIRTQ